MLYDESRILCGKCGADASSVIDPQSKDIVTCTGCGRQDRFDSVVKAVAGFHQEAMKQAAADAMARAFRGSKGVVFTPGRIEKMSFRWVPSRKVS
ncbi:hypothetical protein J3454_14190 [Erythrobacter sp. NFXS35]|uniref:hypothetical protein n=1 Tax=Erythrobacter sp. NFXS35 TaxID=2818436 RepID=UPI0032DFD837